MPQVVGTAIVNIVPNTAAFNAAMGQMGATASRALGPATAAVGGLTGALAAGQANLLKAGNAARGVGQAMTGLSLAAAAFGAVGIKAAYDFDTSMRRVGAITGATGEEFDKLDALAQKLGRDTEYTAAQAADGMTNLALAGFRVNEILDAIPGTLRLASAGGMDLAEATRIAANNLRAFNLEADQIGRVNDVLAKTMTRTNTSLLELSYGMKYVAPVAAASGVQFEETTAALGLMSDAGFQGSMAGTALRGAIAKLEKPTEQGAAVLKKLGITTHDASGNLLPLVDIVAQLEKSSFSTADAITLMGQRAGPGFLALTQRGSEALQNLTMENRRAGQEIETLSKFLNLSAEQSAAFGRAFDFTQPMVSRFNYSIDETSAILAALVAQGKTSDQAINVLAGTMRAMQNDAILPLVGATRNLDGALINSEGEILGVNEVLAILQSKGMTTAESLAVLGTDAAAMASAVGLSQDELGKMTEKLENSGTAAEIAAKQMEGIKGGFLRLKSSVEAIGILAFGGENGLINKLGDAMDALALFLNKIMEMNPMLIQIPVYVLMAAGAFGILARVAGALLRGLAGLLGIMKFFVGHPIILALTALAAVLIGAYTQSEAFREAVYELWTAFDDLFDAVVGLFVPAVDDAGAAMGSAGDEGVGFADVLEGIGNVLAPVVSGITFLVDGLSSLANWLGESQSRMAGFAAVLGGVPIAGFAATFAVLLKVTGSVGVALSAIAGGPIALIVAGIAAVGTAFYLAYTRVEPFRNAIDSMIDVVGGFASAVIDGLGTAFGILQAIFTGDLSGIDQQMRGLVDVVFVLRDGWLRLSEGASGAISAMSGPLQTLSDIIAGIYVQPVIDGFSALFALFTGDFAGAADIAGGMLSGLWENIQRLPAAVVDLLGTAFDSVAGLADIGLGIVNRLFLSVMQSVGDTPVVGELVTAIYGAIRSNLETLGGIGDLLAGIFTLDPARIGEGLQGIGQGILTVIQVQIPGLLGAVGDLFRDIIPNALRSLSESVRDIPFFGDIASGVLDGLGSAFEAVGGVADLIAGLFTFDMARVTDSLGGIAGAVANFLTGLPAKTLGALGDAGEWLGGIITSAADWVVENFPKLMEKLKDLPELLVSAIGGLFGGGGDGGGAGGAAAAAAPGADEGNPIVKFISTAITSAKDWIINDGIPTLGGAIADFATRLPGILGGILGGIFRASGAIVTGLLGLIADWGGDIAEGLFNVMKWAFNWLVENGPGILATIGGWLASLPGTLLGFLGDLGGTLLGWLGSAFSWLAENAGNAITTFLGWVAGLPAQILQGLANFAESLLFWMVNAWTWLTENGPTILANVWTWISGIPGQIMGFLGDLGSTLVGWLTAAWGWVVENGPMILEAVWAWISGLPGTLIGLLGDLGSKLLEWLRMAWDWVVINGPIILTAVWGWISSIPGTLISTLGDIGGKIFDWLKGAFDFVVTRGGDLISGLLDWFKALPGKIFDAVSGAIGAVAGGASDIGKKIFNAVGGFLNEKLIDPIRGVEFFGQTPLAGIPRIPMLAEGGIIRVATAAIVGEAGPEVVIPLTDPDRAKELVAASGLLGLIAGEPLGGVGAAMPAGAGAAPAGFAVAPPPTDVNTGPAVGAVTGAMSAVATGALTALQPVADWFTTVGTQAATSMTEFGNVVWAATEPGLTLFVEQFRAMFDGLTGYLLEWQAGVATLLTPFGVNLWAIVGVGMSFFRSQFEGVFAGIGVYLNTWLSSIRSGFESLPAFLSGIASQITSALKSPFTGFASGTWNPFASALNSALRQIPATAGITIPSLPTAHSGGIIGERLPQTGGPLAPDEMVVKMQRGEGVIPADVMRDMTPAEFEAIRSGGGLMMAKPQTDAWVRVPGTGQPYGPVVPAAQGMAASGFVDGVVVQNLKAAAAQVSGSIRSLLSGFFMPRFLGGVSSTFVDESVKFVESKVAEQNRKAMEAIGAGDAFPGGLPIGLDAAIARVAAMRGQGGSYRALIDYIRATGVPHVITSTVRPGSRVRGSGNVSLHSLARAIDIAGPSGGRDTPEMLRIYRAFAPVRNLLAEIIYSGPGGNYFGRTGTTADDHHDHVHVGLANGALITRPMSALIGEAGPEVVLPLNRPARALQLAQGSGLLGVLAEAQAAATTDLGPSGATRVATTATQAATMGQTGLFPGSGNVYNIYGVGMQQVIAEIKAREDAAARTRLSRR